MNNETGDKRAPAAASFTTFVLSLSTAALQHMGEKIGDEEDAISPCVNLAIAKQTIDVLEMLEHKTNGNLSVEEARLLGNVLYDLRMRYVKMNTKHQCEEV